MPTLRRSTELGRLLLRSPCSSCCPRCCLVSPVSTSLTLDGLSIPFFSLGRRVHSITYTWSRQPSMRDNQPAWTSQVRHVQPGQSIIVNRDEDPEDGDVGLNRTSPEGSAREKLGQSSTGGSSDDRTRRDDMEMSEKKRTSSDGDVELDEEADGGAPGERAGHDDNEPGTPPVARYREGNDLIIERKRGGGEEVGYPSGKLTSGRGRIGQELLQSRGDRYP
jgi:hypothetical protein